MFAVSAFVLCLCAQDPKVQDEKKEVIVEEKREPSTTVPSLKEAVRRMDFAPGGVDVIDGDEYRTGRVFLPQDAFRFSPGVYMQTRFGAEESRMSIRGSGIQRTFHGRGMVVMQDGVPINLADGSFDMQAIEPLSARYIEVWRGANALQYGSATLGGAINFVSPTGHDSGAALGRVEGGSFGYVRGQLSLAQAKDAFDVFATFTEFDTDGFRDHADQSNQRIFTNFGYRFSNDVENRLYVTWAQTDSELPGSLTRAQMEADPTQANPANVTGDQKRDFWLARLADRTTWSLGQEARADLTVAWTRKELFHPLGTPGPGVIDQESDDFVLYASYTSETKWFGRDNRFIAGISPAYGLNKDRRYVNVGGQRGPETAANDLSVVNLSAFLEEQHYVADSFALVLGLQASYIEMEQDDVFPVSGVNLDNSGDETYAGVNPKIGARYELDERSQIFFNVSRSYEPPSWGETVSPAAAGGINFPDAQEAWTFEIGTRGGAGIVSWDLAVYHAEIDGELLSLTDGLGNPLGTVNADSTTHSGVEVGLDLTLFEAKPEAGGDVLVPSRILVRQSYLWSRFRFDDDAVYGNNEIAGMPEHLYRVEIRLEHRTGIYVAPNLEWAMSDWFVDHANTVQADGYATYGIQVGYRAAGFTIFVEARNLTDRLYAPTTGVVNDAQLPANGSGNPAVFNPADERSFYAGLEYRY
jgi:iron complex outermembrane receptor protein